MNYLILIVIALITLYLFRKSLKVIGYIILIAVAAYLILKFTGN